MHLITLLIFISTGLAASCDTQLFAEMSVSYFYPIIINNGQVHNSTLTSCSNVTSLINEKNKIEPRMQPGSLQQDSHEQRKKKQNTFSNVTNNNNLSFFGVGRNVTRVKATEEDVAISKPNAIYTEIPSLELPSPSPNIILASKYLFTSTPKVYGKINSNNRNTSDEIKNNEIIYKFYVPRNIGVATARVTFGHVCLQCPDVGFHVQANAFPSIISEAEKRPESNCIYSTIIKPNQTEEISIEFYVQPMTWHYALLQFVKQGFADEPNLDHEHASVRTKREWLQNSEIFEQPRRRNNYTTISPHGNETNIYYHLPFVLQIDYNVRSGGEQDKVERRNVYENQNTETSNEYHDNSTISPDITKNTESVKACDSKQLRGIKFYPVLRQTYREFFMFDYDLVPDENGTVPTVLNLTAGIPCGFIFDVGEVYDIGGTLSFAVSMKHDNKASSPEATKALPPIPRTTERSGILAEKLIGSSGEESNNSNIIENDNRKPDSKNNSRSNQTIIVCMHLGEPGEPTWPDKCKYGRRLLPASSIVNNTDSNTSTGLIHVPFPESGQWYITMGLYCHGAETASRTTIIESIKNFVKKYTHILENIQHPCACAPNLQFYRNCINDPGCLSTMNETETLKIKECLMDSKCTLNHLEMTQKFEFHHKLATEQHFDVENCSTSVVFTISSSPCVAGRCGRYGRCYHYMSGGFVFSTCVCMKGYRGWDCTEDSQVPSSLSILMGSLLLILSNLLFLPSIYIASRRKFYTEAIIYFFAMFFSIFYHACDSGEDEYSFCLVKISVLQFCDFYCGLLAIWVTLVAMSHVRQQFVSLLHMLGAILLAFGTELNKQSLWVFLAPALTGICLISASWGLRCYKTRKWFPSRIYLTVYMPLGTVLVMLGLVCYAFLQTKQNYHIVHSIWHMVMALSILCILPIRKSFIPKC